MVATVKQMIEAANAVVPRISPAQARAIIAQSEAIILDVRDTPELEREGKIDGSVHVPRGMLEFRADPESPYHDKQLSKFKVVLVYCASGGRSALAGKLLKDMGYERVYNLGSFKGWAETVDQSWLSDQATSPSKSDFERTRSICSSCETKPTAKSSEAPLDRPR